MRGATFICVALALGALASPARAQTPKQLLDRYRPTLRYDSSEKTFAHSVDAIVKRYLVGRERSPSDPLPVGGGRGSSREVVYGRVATGGDGRRWLQYWLFYDYNAQDRGMVRTGLHAGDWEVVQLRLNAQARPDRATLAQHSWAESCGRRETLSSGQGPMVFVANASHASYPRPGDVGRPFPDPTDEADGRGKTSRPPVEVIREGSPAWVDWPGRWGQSEAGLVPGEQSSPRGPAFQGVKWSDPSAYDQQARACGSGAPGRRWQWPLLAVVITIPALLMLKRRRRG